VVDDAARTPCVKPDVLLWVDGPGISASDDSAGAVHFDAVMPGTYALAVRCDGYVAVDDSIKLVVTDRDIVGQVWRIQRGGRIRGHVRDAAGEPVAGAALFVNGSNYGDSTTKADGSYEINSLRTGTYDISAQRGDARASLKVDVEIGSIAVRDMTLERGTAIAISVTDTDGARVPNAMVLVDDVHEARTANDGTLHVETFAGIHGVVVQTPGGSNLARRVSVASGRTEPMSFVVDARHGTIQGTVVDVTGAPVSDAYVTAFRDANSKSSELRVLVRPDGTFTLSPLAAGTYFIHAEQMAAASAFVEHIALGSTVRIELRPLGSIAGHVSGDPAQLEIQAVDVTKSVYEARSESFFHTHGAFHVQDLAAGKYRITADADGAHAQRTIELAEGAHLTNMDLTPDASLGLVGRVVDLKTKQPLPGVEVFAWLQGVDTRNHGTTDGDGRFTIGGLTHGYLYIRTSADIYASVHLDRQIDTGAVVDLGDIAIVEARVKFDQPVGKIGVQFDDAMRIYSIDPDGPAAHSELVVGDVVTSIDGIDVTGAPLSTAYAMIKAPPGMTIELGLARGITVSITAR
jgi:hypothetical protein